VTVFVDTSALYAGLDADDDAHGAAVATWTELVEDGTPLRTHHGVLVETTALVQRRLGMAAVRDLHHALVPTLSVRWIDAVLHRTAMTALLAAGRRDLSLVDWTSFEMMREERLSDAFAFDADFTAQGFHLVSKG
jgi:predicted nucleic acid-binding protein